MTPTNPLNAGDEIDLTAVLKARILTLGFRYVLIIEWLRDSDKKTGEALGALVAAKIGADRVQYRKCASAADVEAVLVDAVAGIDARGWPIVHMEAHGELRASGETPRGYIGPDGIGGSELLSWSRFGDALRVLNVATRFNVLLVSASCFGEGALLAIDPSKPMPFTALVGYTESVNEKSLRDAIAELYRRLFKHEELSEAVEACNAEHYYEDDAELRLTSAAVLVLEGFIQGVSTRIGTDTKDSAALDTAVRMLRANNYDLSGLPFSSITATAQENARAALRQRWSELWMIPQFPENADRFAIDFDEAVNIAMRMTGHDKLGTKQRPK